MSAMKEMSITLENIARERLDVDTLQTRCSDSLDFHELPVWVIRNALMDAYIAGFTEGKRSF